VDPADALILGPPPRRAYGEGGSPLPSLLSAPREQRLLSRLHDPRAAGGAPRRPSAGARTGPFAPRSLRVLIPTGLVAAAALAALFLPYVRNSHRLEMSRGVDETARFAATSASWLSPVHRNIYSGGLRTRDTLRR